MTIESSYEAILLFKLYDREKDTISDISFPRIMKFDRGSSVEEVHVRLFEYFAALYDFYPVPGVH